MNVGEIRIIVKELKDNLVRDNSYGELLHSFTSLEALINRLPEDLLVGSALEEEIKKIVVTFWEEMSRQPVRDDWETHPTIFGWRQFQERLCRSGWELHDAHHCYFYHCLASQYNGDNEDLPLEKIIPLLRHCCQMIGYADKHHLADYPYKAIKLRTPSRADTFDTHKAIATSFTVLFYLLYHHCTAVERRILKNLVQFFPNICEEEVASETKLLEFLYEQPKKSIELVEQLQPFIDEHELISNQHFSCLHDTCPNSTKSLIDATVHQRWYYFVINCNNSVESAHFLQELIKKLSESFANKYDRAYDAALSFSRLVLKQAENLSEELYSKLISALYYFCLGQYIELRRQQPAVISFFSFSGDTKCIAAKKLQQQELGEPVCLNLNEFMATKEGRLNSLILLFDLYKNARAEQIALVAIP